MNRMYQEVLGDIRVDIDKNIQADVEKYCKKLRLILVLATLVIVAAGIYAIYGISQGNLWGLVLEIILAIVIRFAVEAYKQKEWSKYRFYINELCDVNKALSAYYTVLGKSFRKKIAPTSLYNVGMTLFYGGRFEDCRKVSEYLLKSGDDISGGCSAVLLAGIAYQQKDRAALEQQRGKLQMHMQKKKAKMVLLPMAQAVDKYFGLLDAEEAGDYEKMCELTSCNLEIDPNLKCTIDNYR